jgi:hypothetical protein
MKPIKNYLLIVACVVAFVSSLATTQDLRDQLTKVGTKNVQNYVTPIFNGWATDLNSGIYHSADLHGVLGFDVGLKFGIALITNEDKKYDFLTPDYININSGTDTLFAGIDYDAAVPGVPTAVGDKDTKYYVRLIRSATDPVKQAMYDSWVTTHGSNNLFQIPNGFNLPIVPLFMPQAALGLPFGLEVIIRFIPTISAGDAGKFNYMGFGIRYDLDQHIPMCPVDIAVHFMTQKMNFKSKSDKDVFEATGTAFGAEISKKILLLTLYGGFQIEKSSFKLASIDGKFVALDGTETLFTIPETTYEGKNKSRLTLGARLLLGVVNIHADYNIAKSPVITAGIGVSFR